MDRDPIKRRDIIALNAVGAACLSVAGVTAWQRRPCPWPSPSPDRWRSY